MNFVHLAFYVATAAAAAFAQEGAAPPQSAPQTVIRAETRLVLVDAVVRDKRSEVVQGESEDMACVFPSSPPAPASAQEGPPPPQSAPQTVIRAETRLVLVDAVVRDKKNGKIAPDLAAKDFRVWEDGKERTITSFFAKESAFPEQIGRAHV